ncbi:MAG: hypothetical protein Alpg2KO_31650 [Alphaproteobacteria bacterium]
MSRTLSATARAAIDQVESGEVFLMLLELDGDDLSSPIRVVRDHRPLVSGGVSYEAYPFDLTLPPVGEEEEPSVELQIDNVDQIILASLRAATSEITASLSVVLASTPEVIEDGPYSFTLKNIRYDNTTIRARLAFEGTLGRAWPADRYTPADYPAIFLTS